MKINHIGHSCFLFADSKGTTLLTDPYGDVGIPMPMLSSDIVTISHGHYDHCNLSALRGTPKVYDRAGKYSHCGVAVEARECFHDNAHGAMRGKNLIVSFKMDGVTVCHLGDLGEKMSDGILEKIGHPDILLIPIGGNYTIDAAEAINYIHAVSPSVAIPMHYHVPGLQVDIEDEKRFLKLCGDYSRQHALEIGAADLTAGTQIVVLERM